MVRRLLWDGTVPGTSVGTRAPAAAGLVPARPAAEFLEESQINSSLPCQTGRLEQHQGGPGYLKLLGGNKDKVAKAQRQCSTA